MPYSSSRVWALELDLPAADLALAREPSDPVGVAAYLAQPEVYLREIQTVAVGRVV